MTNDEIVSTIKKTIPDAEVFVNDLNGGGDHLQVKVISKIFKDKSLIKQHQLVYQALSKELASEAIHALALETSIPKIN